MRIALLIATCLAVGRPAIAQRSPVDDLAAAAQNALDNLEYQRAAGLARSLLAIGETDRPDVLAHAYQLLAAAFYPEEIAAQQTDSARHYLRRLIELEPDGSLPRTVSWPGLDGLLEDVRNSTLAVRAEPRADTLRVGRDAVAAFEVRSSQPVRLTLVALGGSERPAVLDAIGTGTRGTLSLRGLVDDVPVLAGGEYELRIVAVTPGSEDSVWVSFRATVESPPLGLEPVPAALDSTLLVPERTSPDRIRNAGIGVGLGAATALLANTLRGPAPVSNTSPDGRAYLAAGAMTVGALVGVFTERSKPIAENIAHNAEVRADFAERVRAASQANAQRRADYRAVIVLSRERP